ncbi:hypothetical protein AYO21_09452 [Fonsecaea monophora]|uniref:RNA polymerase II transcription factor B subunit 2 n=1 Tax=Fonsecaea monophora TaxID=254056 RepID=A0A177EWF4_9EURO|nr:hypothetical protein AYO21_09452 [Fonsecaea monophora]OAG36373.1 hypothetical protein AYO21_09452 [Fonsecaea monophora]
MITISLDKSTSELESQSGATRFDKSDLARLDRFQTRTVLSIGTKRAARVFQREIIPLACANPLLMHLAQAVTESHDRYLCGVATSRPSTTEAYHLNKALISFQSILSRPIRRDEGDALLLASSLLGVVSFFNLEASSVEDVWPLQDTDMAWLNLSDGKQTIWRLASPLKVDSLWRQVGIAFDHDKLPENQIPDHSPSIFDHLCAEDAESSSARVNPYYRTATRLLPLLDLECDDSTWLRSPASALAIFRKRLSALAKSFVLMLLYMPRPLPVKQLEQFVKDTSRGEREHALDLLHRYHIFRDVTLNSTKAYALTPDFAKSLRRALTGAGDTRSFGQVARVPEGRKVTISQLDEYSRQRWEGILGYMVGSSSIPLETANEQPAIEPAPGVIELLKAGHLIEVSGAYSHGQRARITKEGFAFVLQDINTQVWALLFLYVDNAEVFDMDKVDVLSFLFLVSSLELGLAYSTSTLDETQRRCLSDLVSLGLVYQPLSDDGINPANHFYPTRLATTLTSDSASALSTTNLTIGTSLSQKYSSSSGTTTPSGTVTQKGFIIVETNYRVYAYTSSPLQIALLSLFVNLRSRHPNLVTGKMSKASVQRAVQAGITADQIISYLTTHAHPQMRRHAQAEQAALLARGTTTESQVQRTVPILPATILDQIHLWQLERDRMTTTPGFLFRDFSTRAEYEANCRYADETGVLVWKDDAKRLFFVTRLEGVRAFMAERRATGSGGGTQG